jgi:hypothetical protein
MLMLTIDTADSLLATIPLERITSWSESSLGISSEAFATMVERLQELEQDGKIDVLSMSRHRAHGYSQVTAIKFVRVGNAD